METFLLCVGINTTSPDCSNISLEESPFISRSYRSTVCTILPARFTSILRNEPISLTPPAAKIACVTLESELSV